MVKDSFMENTSDGGFLIDIERSLEPNSDVISSWFMESMGLSVNELARKMMLFLEELHQNESIPLTTLTPIAAKLGIVIKRKNSYKVAFSFFMDRLLRFGDEPFERVNDLVNQWHGVAYKMIRVAIHNKRDQIYPLMDKIMEIEKQESAIKQEIYSWYLNWEEACRKSVVGGGWVP